jgi:hypothetical protein
MTQNRSYRPPLAPDKFTRRTLREQADAMRRTSEFLMEELHVEPAKPRLGMVVYADGSDWNPGYGAGLYVYGDGYWAPLQAGGSGVLIGHSAVQIQHTGDTSNTELASITIPGGTLGANGFFVVNAIFGRVSGTAGTITGRVRWSGTAGNSLTALALTTAQFSFHEQRLVANRNAENSQICFVGGSSGFGTSTGSVDTYSVDSSVDTTVKFMLQLANAADVGSLEFYSVQIFRRT